MRIIYNALAFLLSISIFISCDKSGDGPDPIVDSIPGIKLPKGFVIEDVFSSTAYSIKFDTLHLSILIYEDDTTNANPYDELTQSYTYNAAGYLISHEYFVEGERSRGVSISRASDNRIIYAANDYNEGRSIDSTFFKYLDGTGRIGIETNKFFYERGVYSDLTIKNIYQYDVNNRLESIVANRNQEINKDTTVYAYNANGSRQKISLNSKYETAETKYFYESGLAYGKEDIFRQIILGKDHYLENVLSVGSFPFVENPDYYSISLSDPFHASKVQTNSNTSFDPQYLYQYTLNDQQLPLTIAISDPSYPDGDVSVTFIYE